MQRAALTPALSRRERENISRGFRRVEPRVLWNEYRRLARRVFWSHLARECDSLSLRERAGVREPVSTLAIAAMERFMERSVIQNWTRIGTMDRGEIHHRDKGHRVKSGL
jgi:hypothetical protein